MGILGLTHDENGTAFEKLPVTIKVAIGEGPEPGNGNSHPRRLDHFVFKRKTLRGQDLVWEPAPDISNAHGEKPTALGIIFLNDDPREVFRTEYALWTPSGRKCHGELVQIANNGGLHYEMRATRRTQKHPEGETWPGNYMYVDGPKKSQPVEPCGDGCPDLERGDCKPSGDLYFILEKFPTFGAICRLHTSSYRSIRNLSNGLMQIRRLNGGNLSGVKATLKASPERVSYADRDGTRHTSVAYILSLEIGGTDLRSLVANMTEPARLLSEGRPTIELSRGVQYVVHESDTERAKEIGGEFYPDISAVAGEGIACVTPGNCQSDGDEQLARICEVAHRLGYNDAKTKMLIGQSADNLAELERKLLSELDERPAPAPSPNGENAQKRQPERKMGQTSGSGAPGRLVSPPSEEPTLTDEGFFF
jgi:Recombination directionality factor-like